MACGHYLQNELLKEKKHVAHGGRMYVITSHCQQTSYP
ncbi:hypothetical protein LLB_3720 [Legionella longbeachae D-4968]|nr:hypothetical protein LLB_3720 [Legionella longbeachae D-4968]